MSKIKMLDEYTFFYGFLTTIIIFIFLIFILVISTNLLKSLKIWELSFLGIYLILIAEYIQG